MTKDRPSESSGSSGPLPPTLPFTFHHLGLAVSRPDGAERFLVALGYAPGPTVRDDIQRVHVALATHPTMPSVELVWPTEVDGPLTSMLRAQTELAYHLAYECDGIVDAIAAIEAIGRRVLPISPPQPAVLFGGRRVSFQRVAGFGIIELIERQLPVDVGGSSG